MPDNSPSETFPASTAISEELIESSRIIAETASDAVITIDKNSTIVFVNRAAVNVFGYSTEEMLGAQLTMLMPEYLRHLHRAGLKSYLETGKRHISWNAVELPGLHKNGQEISLELSFGEFRKDGALFFTGIARDITRRKRDERRLAVQHSLTGILAQADRLKEAAPKLLQTICEHLGWQFAALWLVVPEQNELHCAAQWRHELSDGVTEFQEITRQSHFKSDEGLPGKVLAANMPLWVPDYAKQGFPRSAAALHGNLHSAFAFPLSAGEDVLGVIELFAEVGREADQPTLETLAGMGSQIAQFIQRKNVEQEKARVFEREQQARLKAEGLANQLAALQKVTDAALAYLSIDEVIAESLTRIRDALKVDTVAILLLEADEGELVAWAAQGLEEEVERGVRIPIGKGFAGRVVAEARPIIVPDVEHTDVFNPLLREKGIKSLLGVPLFVEGRTTGVIHVGTLNFYSFTQEDVRLLQLTADRIALAIENARLYQVERQARAEAEDANRAKDEFLTLLSHELRTPLTPIIGWVHMMQNGILQDTDFDKALSVINRNAYSLKSLINDLLDMSAILSGKMRIETELVPLPDVLQDAVESMSSFALECGVQLALKIAPEAAGVLVIGDRNRLNQTFCNLIHNAIKFSLAGGKVEIVCEADDFDAIVRVKDRGQGIPADFLPHVFERFRQADGSRTRAYGGLGLGLALVKSFVEAHEGTVEAASDGEGTGSVFIIKLARHNPVVAEGGAGKEKVDQKIIPGKRILIVEDQPDTLEMLAANFRTRGYETISCGSAEEALQLAGGEHFDILISDIAMPVMDGLQLISGLRKIEGLKRFPAIALTGYASKTDAETAMAAGFDLHLSKPIDPSELLKAVENLLISHDRQNS